MPRPAIARREEGAYGQYSTPVERWSSADLYGMHRRSKMGSYSCVGPYGTSLSTRDACAM